MVLGEIQPTSNSDRACQRLDDIGKLFKVQLPLLHSVRASLRVHVLRLALVLVFVQLAFHLADDEVDVLQQPGPGLDFGTEQLLTQNDYTIVSMGTVKVSLDRLAV